MRRKAHASTIRSAAREDILRQYSYYLVEKNAPTVARRFLDSVESAIKELCTTPGVGAPKVLANPALLGLRSWPVAGFRAMRVYYISVEGVVRIVRVLHGRRDIASLLESETSNEE